MLKRLFVGLIKGAILGAGLVAAAIYGLHMTELGSWLAYAAAVVAGLLVGLVAGKPIWADGAKIEAGLKAAFGAILGVLVMVSLRRWVPIPALPTHVAFAGFNHDSVLALPMVTMILGTLFELDNTPAPAKEEAPRVRAPKGKASAAESDLGDEEDDESASAPRRNKRG